MAAAALLGVEPGRGKGSWPGGKVLEGPSRQRDYPSMDDMYKGVTRTFSSLGTTCADAGICKHQL